MPCTVKKTFEIAKATGNDLIVQVKENQSNLQHRLDDLATTARPLETDHRRDRARNRQEDRLAEGFDPPRALRGTEWAPLPPPGGRRRGPLHRGGGGRPPPHPDPLRRDGSLDRPRGNCPLRLCRYAARCNLR